MDRGYDKILPREILPSQSRGAKSPPIIEKHDDLCNGRGESFVLNFRRLVGNQGWALCAVLNSLLFHGAFSG
jgi:hypothetical protein